MPLLQVESEKKSSSVALLLIDVINDLDFEQAARYRDELKRLRAVELAIAGDPLVRQSEVEAETGLFAGAR